MTFFRTDDPERDFNRWDLEKERQLARLPVCEGKKCGKRIQDDYYFEIEGEILCEECMNAKYRKSTEDYIEID